MKYYLLSSSRLLISFLSYIVLKYKLQLKSSPLFTVSFIYVTKYALSVQLAEQLAGIM